MLRKLYSSELTHGRTGTRIYTVLCVPSLSPWGNSHSSHKLEQALLHLKSIGPGFVPQ